MVGRERRRGEARPGGDAGEARAARSVRAGYLWYFAAIGAFTPFATLYYRELGFTGPQVGLLAALPALAVALSGPLWGALADTRAIHRLVLRAALLLTALLALAVARASAFAPVALLVALLAIAQAPIVPLLDGYAVTVAERAGRSYGALRVWGSVGFTAAALAVGRLMGDRVSNLVLLAYAACLALGLVAVLGLPPLGERATRPLFGGLGLLARNRPLAVLLLTAYLISTGGALLYNFLGIHLQDLGASADLVGLAVAIGAASEFPVVAFGGRFLARLGAPRLVALAILVYAARFAALTVIPSPAWTLPVQALHGLSFGAFLIASVPLAHRLAGPGQAATAQALLTAVSFGLGSITGSLLGGALLDRIGTVGLFRGAVGLMLITLAVFLVGERATGAAPSGTRKEDADRPRRLPPS